MIMSYIFLRLLGALSNLAFSAFREVAVWSSSSRKRALNRQREIKFEIVFLQNTYQRNIPSALAHKLSMSASDIHSFNFGVRFTRFLT
jgi:hypothetical protein